MSETGPEAEGAHRYFQAIEEVFVRLRGAPLLLSPADWQVARRWHGEGIPLEVVVKALEEVFARRRERQAKGKIQSLRYCAPAVEQAWAEIRELTAAGHAAAAPPLDTAGRLAALAAALPAELPGRGDLARRIQALTGSTEAVEEALAALDTEILEGLEAGLEDRRRELEAATEAALRPVAGRLPAAELEAARGRLRRQLLRRQVGLPVLSLFSPEAEPAG